MTAPPKTWPRPKQLAAEMSESLAETERLLERLTAELADWNANKASLERGRDMAAALLETSTDQLVRRPGAPGRSAGSARTARPTSQPCEAQTEEAREQALKARATAAEARAAFADRRDGGSRMRAIRWKPPSAKSSACPPK